MPYGQLITNKSVQETRQDIEECFAKWGVDSYRFLPARLQGRPVAEAGVEFTVRENPQILRCSRFFDHRTNLRAVFLILDSLRKAAERGILEELARAALAMLPPGKVRRPPHEVLRVTPDAPLEVAEAAYKALAKRLHPDTGGSHEAMRELNEAWEEFQTTAKEKGP